MIGDPPKSHPCPTCGSCPTCGRGSYYPYVPYANPNPWGHLPMPPWGGTYC